MATIKQKQEHRRFVAYVQQHSIDAHEDLTIQLTPEGWDLKKIEDAENCQISTDAKREHGDIKSILTVYSVAYILTLHGVWLRYLLDAFGQKIVKNADKKKSRFIPGVVTLHAPTGQRTKRAQNAAYRRARDAGKPYATGSHSTTPKNPRHSRGPKSRARWYNAGALFGKGSIR